jgi:hypothetical protein
VNVPRPRGARELAVRDADPAEYALERVATSGHERDVRQIALEPRRGEAREIWIGNGVVDAGASEDVPLDHAFEHATGAETIPTPRSTERATPFERRLPS